MPSAAKSKEESLLVDAVDLLLIRFFVFVKIRQLIDILLIKSENTENILFAHLVAASPETIQRSVLHSFLYGNLDDHSFL